MQVFRQASFEFYKFLRKKMTPELREALAELSPGAVANDQLFDLFVPYMFTFYNDELASYKCGPLSHPSPPYPLPCFSQV